MKRCVIYPLFRLPRRGDATTFTPLVKKHKSPQQLPQGNLACRSYNKHILCINHSVSLTRDGVLSEHSAPLMSALFLSAHVSPYFACRTRGETLGALLFKLGDIMMSCAEGCRRRTGGAAQLDIATQAALSSRLKPPKSRSRPGAAGSFVGEARAAQLATAANFLEISISSRLHLRCGNHSGRLPVFLVTWHLMLAASRAALFNILRAVMHTERLCWKSLSHATSHLGAV